MNTQPVEIPLVVTGVDLNDEATLEHLGESCDDMVWAASGGAVTATVYADADVVDAAVDAARRIRAAVAGARAVRVDPDLVTIPGIATRVGVSRQAVQQWAAGGGAHPFPEPFNVLQPENKPVKVWRWADITPWLWHAKGLAFEHLPTGRQAARIEAALTPESETDSMWRSARLVPHLMRVRTPHRPSVRTMREGA